MERSIFVVSKHDVAGFVCHLKNKTLNESTKIALDAACSHGQNSTLLDDRHIYVYCLVASKGFFNPVKEWMQGIYYKVKGSPVCDYIFMVCFLSAFRNSSDVLSISLPNFDFL